ncbi:nucleic-acid-binding protein from transposon X-element [Trichonephila clavipes]|nr:nucleic-acid-binding protein from transposon X-element [Trichonephila clavipes]
MARKPLTDSEDEGFSVVSRKKKIASIVIDASNNTTRLLNTLSEYLGTTLEGRFENGKLRVFPKTYLEHRKLQSYLAQKKMRSHTFEMADNKQLKAVIRGLPTDYDQKEIATELKGFGFEADHISILRNRKNNTNMPLFLVVLKRTQENKEIFHVTNIGFFRVVVEPLKGSSMPPQCYRCQEFYHHSRLCNRAPKCLKCSGGHLTAECKKSIKSPAKCANCGGPHPANFSGCPSNPVNKKQHKNKPNNNIWTEKAKARAQKATPHQQPKTYASAVAQNKKETNTFDANAIMEQMGSDNIAADVLSRVSAITFPSQIDYDCIAETQQTDQELHTLIAFGTSLELKKKNHSGSAGKMEVCGMQKIFLRSEQKHGLKYQRYIGDGDSKTFLSIAEKVPYGDSVPIVKIECGGYV